MKGRPPPLAPRTARHGLCRASTRPCPVCRRGGDANAARSSPPPPSPPSSTPGTAASSDDHRPPTRRRARETAGACAERSLKWPCDEKNAARACSGKPFAVPLCLPSVSSESSSETSRMLTVLYVAGANRNEYVLPLRTLQPPSSEGSPSVADILVLPKAYESTSSPPAPPALLLPHTHPLPAPRTRDMTIRIPPPTRVALTTTSSTRMSRVSRCPTP